MLVSVTRTGAVGHIVFFLLRNGSTYVMICASCIYRVIPTILETISGNLGKIGLPRHAADCRGTARETGPQR